MLVMYFDVLRRGKSNTNERRGVPVDYRVTATRLEAEKHRGRCQS